MMAAVPLLVAAAVLCARAAAAAAAPSITLSDDTLKATFGGDPTMPSDFGLLVDLTHAKGGASVVDRAAAHTVWSASFVGSGAVGAATISSATASCAGREATPGGSSTAQTFRWLDCAVTKFGAGAVVNVTVDVALADGLLGYTIAFDGHGTVSLWDYALSVTGVVPTANAVKTTAARQLLGFYDDASAVYFAAHDPAHVVKTCATTTAPVAPPPAPPRPPGSYSWVEHNNSQCTGRCLPTDSSGPEGGHCDRMPGCGHDAKLPFCEPEPMKARCLNVSGCDCFNTNGYLYSGTGTAPFKEYPLQAFAIKGPPAPPPTPQPPAASKPGDMSCTILSLNATLPLHHYKAAFPVVVGIIPGGDWWDIASMYRAWVLPNSEWTKFGRLDSDTRKKTMPEWLENITLWANNNWGGDPLKPNYGGDPAYVQNEMLKLNTKLDLPSHGGHLALHWYEWDTRESKAKAESRLYI